MPFGATSEEDLKSVAERELRPAGGIRDGSRARPRGKTMRLYFGRAGVRLRLMSVLLLSPLPALASPPPPLTQTLTGAAKDAFLSAQMLLNNGDAAGALMKYAEAYGLSKDPRLL